MTERGSVSGKAGQRRSPRRRAAPPTPDALRPTPEPRNRTGRIKDGTACTWLYDAIYRLTEQQKSGQAATFSYDNAGNLLVKAHEGSNPYSFTYDAVNRLVTSIQGASQLTTFTHDNNGNLTGERCDTLGTLLTWVYDNENRCINEVRPSGANHTYAYAENGLRWSWQQGGSVHVHNSIWVDDDVINDYVDGGLSGRYDVVDGEVLSYRAGGSRNLYVPDPLGSVNHLLDTSLNKAATYVYWPYGELQTNTGAGSNRQFVGALGYDTLTTNRLYVRAREYRPDLGRWQTEDPIGFAGGDWNLYGYGDDSPASWPDPSGMGSEPDQSAPDGLITALQQRGKPGGKPPKPSRHCHIGDMTACTLQKVGSATWCKPTPADMGIAMPIHQDTCRGCKKTWDPRKVKYKTIMLFHIDYPIPFPKPHRLQGQCIYVCEFTGEEYCCLD